MLYWLIPVGVIVGSTLLILVWMILTCNDLIILQKYIDRTLPLINVKIKDYMTKSNRFLDMTKTKKNIEEYEDIKELIKKVDEMKDILKKVTCYRKITDKVAKLIENVNKKEKAEELKKLIQEMENIDVNINKTIQRRNRAANFYNKKITRWPSKWVAERFKFNEETGC